MRSRQLECFVRVCELSSITKAARTLNIAQPALGIQIKALEREFGAQLLERTVFGTRPTAAGELFLAEAKYILRRLHDLKRSLRDQAEGAVPVVTLGVSPSLTVRLTTRLIERVQALVPRVTLTVVEELSHVLIERVEAGRLDLALIFNAPASRSFERQPQFREAIYLVTRSGSRFDRPEPITMAELTEVELATPGDGDVLRRLVEDEMHRAGYAARFAFSIGSMQAIKSVIARGLACGVLPRSAVADEVEAGSLAVRGFADPAMARTLYLVRPTVGDVTAASSSVASAVKALLRELCVENPDFEPI